MAFNSVGFKIALVAPQAVPPVQGGAENLWAGLLQAFQNLPNAEAHFITLPTPETTLTEVLSGYLQFAELELNDYDLVVTTKYPAWAVCHTNQVVYLQHTLRGLYDTYPSGLGYALSAALRHRLCKAFELPLGVSDALGLASQPVWGPYDRSLAVQWVEQVFEQHRTNTNATAWLARQLHGLCGRLAAARPQDRGLLAFPGPFARACVRLMDAVALAPERIAGYSAISRTVAERQDYFPAHVQVGVQHHPSFTPIGIEDPASKPTAPRDLIVTASRLDAPKRLDLLIKAYGQSGLRQPFWIIGTGPEQARLQSLAEQTPGVVLKGYLSSQELVAAYQRAVFVPFVPYQEDYGLITVEAFMAGAPVVTTTDAGGPTELVRPNETGLVAEPTVQSLAQAFRELAGADATGDGIATATATATATANRQAMAAKGQQQVQALTWPGLAGWLLELAGATGFASQEGLRKSKANALSAAPALRPRLLVLNTFAVEPTVSGGRLRMKGLYSALSQWFDIHLVSLASPIVTPHLRRHSPFFVEELLPTPAALLEFESGLSRSLGVSAFDCACALRPDLLPELDQAIARQLRLGVDAVVCSHPYCFPVYEKHLSSQSSSPQPLLVYEAHNVESALKADMYPTASSALHAIQALETRLLKQADLVVASSDQDRVYFEDIARGQGFEMRACLVANNAVESHSALFTQWAARKQYVQQQSLHIALFAGSWHGPNLQAVDAIIQAAEQLTNDPQLGGGADWRFVVLGSVGDAYAVKPSGVAALTTVQGMKSGLKFGFHGLVKHWPGLAKRLAGLGARARPLRRGPSGSSCEKIHFTGVVSEAEKAAWLARATVGLNPILTGSGTNLKMAEYAAWGLPVLSTAFGARGGIWKEDSHYGLIDAEATQDLPLAINNALNCFLQQARQEGVIENRVSCAQATVRQTLDWSVSAKAMRNGINAMMNNNHPG